MDLCSYGTFDAVLLTQNCDETAQNKRFLQQQFNKSISTLSEQAESQASLIMWCRWVEHWLFESLGPNSTSSIYLQTCQTTVVRTTSCSTSCRRFVGSLRDFQRTKLLSVCCTDCCTTCWTTNLYATKRRRWSLSFAGSKDDIIDDNNNSSSARIELPVRCGDEYRVIQHYRL